MPGQNMAELFCFFWINDCLLVVGSKKGVKKAKQKLIDIFDCGVIRNMDEYVGCKLEHNYEEH
jgi:hypothetical protein